ncbi:MAG: hypothetical protein VKP70_02965 [Cyanobacteriota bacterium]|nr:hypothetical protein [Cyanobacteriota bacterium]
MALTAANGRRAGLLTLFAVGLLSRWATRGQLVQAWDAGNFVLALDGFDLEGHAPHMPGVFWCLIALGRLFRPLVGGDGVAALELVNAVASASALPCGWWSGRQFGGPMVGAWMAGLLFSAPLLWFYASQPLSYGAELGWVVAIGSCAWQVAAGQPRPLLPLAVLMATAGGIRPNTPLFLLPLVLVACWRGWRQGVAGWRFGAALALGLGLLAAWGGAFLAEVGGFERFWPLFQSWKGDHTGQSLGGGLVGNGWLLLRSVGLTAPAALALALLGRRQPQPSPDPGAAGAGHRWHLLFLGLWILPSAGYLVFVHFTRMGHATTLLPGVLLGLAWRLAANGGPRATLRWPRDLALVVVAQCLLFLLVPGDRFAASLRDFDREWGQAIAAARRFDPATTLVITTGRSSLRAFRLPSVHLPAYDHDQADFKLDQKGPSITVRPPLRRLVVLDRGLRVQPPPLAGVRSEMVIPDRLRVLEVPIPPDGLEVERGAIRALPAPADARGPKARS